MTNNLTKNEQKILDYLKEINVFISLKELAKNIDMDLGNLSKYVKKLLNKDEILTKMVKDGKRHMKFVSLNDGKEREISNDDLSKKAKIIPKKPKTTLKIEKSKNEINDTNIDIVSLKNEIMSEIDKNNSNKMLIHKTKSEIIKFINTVAIRETDKKELGYKGMTSKSVRSHLIDLIDTLIIFKQ